MANVFVSVDGRGKYFDKDHLIENGITIEEDFDGFWVKSGYFGFFHDTDLDSDEVEVEIDGIPLQEFLQEYSY